MKGFNHICGIWIEFLSFFITILCLFIYTSHSLCSTEFCLDFFFVQLYESGHAFIELDIQTFNYVDENLDSVINRTNQKVRAKQI